MDKRNQHRMSESRPWTTIAAGLPPGMKASEANEYLRRRYGTTCAHFDEKTGMGVATSKEGKKALVDFANAVDYDAD